MTVEQKRKELIEFIRKSVIPNISDFRWELAKLTSWGFWVDQGGEDMISIDDSLAMKIAKALKKEAKFAPEFFIDEVNEIFGFLEE